VKKFLLAQTISSLPTLQFRLPMLLPSCLFNQTASSHLSQRHENKPKFINPEYGGGTLLFNVHACLLA
jgi:hypothetical protein